MRLFLAVSVGEQFTIELTTQLAPWRSGLSLRWTSPEAWHLTLQFLGEWPEIRVSGLISALDGACRLPSFLLRPGSLDAFPNLESPRVLFLQMTDDGSCARLAGRVRETVQQVWPGGPQDRRDFRAHLTLGRVGGRLSPDEINFLKDKELGPFEAIQVEGFKLYRSVLGPRGPRYSELAYFPLRKKGE